MIYSLILFSYLLGSVPTGLILARGAGVDIRQHGSGNIGATNVGRTLGRMWGGMTLVGDVAKAMAPMLLVGWYLKGSKDVQIWMALAGAAAFLGHLFPIYLGFKGGKGVATALGVFLLLSPLALMANILLFILVVWRSGYVSLGSIMAAAVMPLGVWLETSSIALTTITAFMSTLIWIKHRDNIRRLLNHTEKGWKKK